MQQTKVLRKEMHNWKEEKELTNQYYSTWIDSSTGRKNCVWLSTVSVQYVRSSNLGLIPLSRVRKDLKMAIFGAGDVVQRQSKCLAWVKAWVQPLNLPFLLSQMLPVKPKWILFHTSLEEQLYMSNRISLASQGKFVWPILHFWVLNSKSDWIQSLEKDLLRAISWLDSGAVSLTTWRTFKRMFSILHNIISSTAEKLLVFIKIP